MESVNAAANIFLGAGVTPFLLQPYLKDLTLSELHSVLASGFATVAANLMAAYITFGISASHLLSASFMSAPAALACAKMIYPETQAPKEQHFDAKVHGEGKYFLRSEINIVHTKKLV